MSILQNIFSDHFHKLLNSNIKIRDTVIENVDKMIHWVTSKGGMLFTFVNIVPNLWFLLLGAEAVSAPPAATSTPENVQPLCPLNLSALLTGTAFLLSLKN